MIPPDTTSAADISRNPACELPVIACSHPTNHEPAKAPRAPQELTSASISPATLLGSISGKIAQNGPYGAYMQPPARIRNPYAAQKL